MRRRLRIVPLKQTETLLPQTLARPASSSVLVLAPRARRRARRRVPIPALLRLTQSRLERSFIPLIHRDPLVSRRDLRRSTASQSSVRRVVVSRAQSTSFVRARVRFANIRARAHRVRPVHVRVARRAQERLCAESKRDRGRKKSVPILVARVSRRARCASLVSRPSSSSSIRVSAHRVAARASSIRVFFARSRRVSRRARAPSARQNISASRARHAAHAGIATAAASCRARDAATARATVTRRHADQRLCRDS